MLEDNCKRPCTALAQVFPGGHTLHNHRGCANEATALVNTVPDWTIFTITTETSCELSILSREVILITTSQL